MGTFSQTDIDMTQAGASSQNPCLFLTFHGDTRDLLRRIPDSNNRVAHPLSRRASIKDILEGLGVPHTEIGRIVLDGQEQTFETIPEEGEHYEIHPLSPALQPTVATILRPEPLTACIFLVDINVGRLAGLLRMAGVNAEAVSPGSDNTATVLKAVRESRILLTCNRDLLKLRLLVFGRLVRSQVPDRQLREIVDLYRLQDRLQPFSRCIACNGLLAEIEKETIIDRLLPLTKKYFDRYKQCPGCGKIYWHGSHHEKMTNKLKLILGKTPRQLQ